MITLVTNQPTIIFKAHVHQIGANIDQGGEVLSIQSQIPEFCSEYKKIKKNNWKKLMISWS